MTQISESELKQIIQDIDFSMIIEKMVDYLGWKQAEAEEACRLYKNWVYLTAKYPEKSLPPSEDVDEFWHNHILDTAKYRVDCERVFGHFLDHYPYFGIDENSDLSDLSNAFDETQRLHYEEFGEYIYEIRTRKFLKFVSFFRDLKKRLWKEAI